MNWDEETREIGPNQNFKLAYDLGLLRSFLDVEIVANGPVTIWVTNDAGVAEFDAGRPVAPVFAYSKGVREFDRRVRVPRASSVVVIIVNYDKESGRKVKSWTG